MLAFGRERIEMGAGGFSIICEVGHMALSGRW